MSDEFDLDDDERELIRKRREARKAEDFAVRIRDDRGNESELPYGKARSWLQKTFGIDLEPEPDETEAQPEPKDKPKPAAGGKAVQFGRRVG